VRGIVFTEFLDFVDQSFPGATRQIVPSPALGASLSPVATYPEESLRDLVQQLSRVADRPVAELLTGFGKHLFRRFAAIYPVFFKGPRDALSFLSSVHDHVHGDLRRFHPDAELPDLRCERHSSRHLVLEYRSARSLADLAEGLIRGCVEYFGDELEVTREDLPAATGEAARFTLAPAAESPHP
jgi:hypothetical protein